MDPNLKLILEEIVKIRVEIKEGFTMQEASFSKWLDEVSADKIRDAGVTNLKDATATFDKTFSEWCPEVDSSIASIRFELSKLNTYFIHEAKASGGSTPGVLANESTPPQSPAADDSNGHRVESSHRDCGFGRVFTQIHDQGYDASASTPT
jgi:hypothetical protein